MTSTLDGKFSGKTKGSRLQSTSLGCVVPPGVLAFGENSAPRSSLLVG